MKKILLLIVMIPLLGFYGCEKDDLIENRSNVLTNTGKTSAASDACGEVAEFTLWAGQHINAGSLLVYNDIDYLFVTFETSGDWYIGKTHLHIADDLSGIPSNNRGIPVPGQFAYNTTHDPAVTSYTYTFLLSDLGYTVDDTFVVAAHAEVMKYDIEGNVVQGETAWGGDVEGPGPRWWFYGYYAVQACSDNPSSGIEPGDFRTQTQGGWGTSASGNNPGTYRDANFEAAFPDGLTVGGYYTINLTSSFAVQNFLPQGGPAATLTMNYLDPSASISVFAGQVVALSLSVGFDLYDPDFGASSVNLKDLVFASGVFEGQTVEYLLEEANRVLGGGVIGGYSIGELNDAVASINENFVDGQIVADADLVVVP